MTEQSNQQFFDKIIESGRRKKISRRDFMTHSLAAGLTMASATSLWSTKVAASTPQKGGTFRVGVHDGNTTDSMDPGTFQSVGQIQLAHTHRSYLTEITDSNGLGPDMALSWSASPDAKEWTFELATNASFHSGKKFSAKDAIASLNHHRGEKTTSAAAPLLSDVVDIKASGDNAIVISLSQGIADLPWILADYHLVMLPANDDGTIDWQSMDGAGPYKIVEHEAGVGTEMVRHDGWHREGAYFDEVKFTILNDANARQTALMTGDIDSITSVDLKTFSLLSRNPQIAVDNVPSGSAITLPMFCDVAPFDNVDFRLAMKYAINRQEIIDKIFFGTASLGNDVHVSPNMPYYADLEQRPYDPEKAKFHLKKAGMTSASVDLSAADSVLSGAVDMCVLYSAHAKPAGININVVREPADGYWSNVWLKKPFVFVKWGARPTPDNMLTLAYKDGAAWNESHWSNARFNELLLMAKAELDDTRRGEMYHEMQVLAKDDGGTVLPVFANFVCARRKNVMHGESISASWENDGGRAAHRWWFG